MSSSWFIVSKVLDKSINKAPAKPCLSTLILKIFETNSSFHVKEHATAKVQFVFQFSAITDRIFISGGGLSTRQHSVKF